jgi:RHS repeat-associated protein
LLARSTASGAAANTNVIYVTGAGSTDFNGTYTWAAGAYWKYDTMRIMTFYEGGVCMWGLYYYYATINNGTLEYYTPSLDISGTWYKAFGTNPAPTAGFGGNVTNSVFYHADGNGNVTCLIDTNNVVQGCYSYDPYGNLLAMSGPLAEANTYRFSSKEWNGKAALYYYGYRFYDPNLQRWLNRDPFGEYGGLNLYGYVYNDPLGMLDPYGLALFGLYDSYGDYFSDVWDTFKGEGKGAGAELSFGLYKPCYTSALQRQGGYVGTGLAMAGETLAGGAGGWKAAGKAAKGMEYSHWVPARALPGGRGGLLDDLTKAAKLNGNYVSKAEHALSDPSRYRFMPKTWKAANPLPDPLTQQLNRLPLFPTGLAAGAGVAAAGAAASSGSGGGCQ